MEYQRAMKPAQKEQSKTLSSSLHQTSLNHIKTHPLLDLQRTIGNQAVLNILRSQKIRSNTTTQAFREPRFSHAFSQIPIHSTQAAAPRANLKVSQPGDVYEQDADQVAEQVMRKTDVEATAFDDEDEAENSLMRKQSSQTRNLAATDMHSVLPIVHDVFNGGGGQPLDATTRAFMEPRFGHDFSKVRVHTDEQAAESAHRVNALAYTLGQNVVFGEGKYAPGTSEGKKLIAHELTHTIQQEEAGTFSQTVQKEPVLAVHGTFVQRQPDDSPDASVPAQATSAASSAADLSQQYQAALQLARQKGDWRNAAELLNAFNHEDIQLRLAQLTVDEIGYLHQGALDNPRVGSQSQVALLTEPGTPLASTTPPTATQAPPVPILETPSSGGVEQNAQISTGRRFPTDAQPWQDLQILPAVEDELPSDTFALSNSAITNGIYRIYPQLRNHDDPHVVYYIAYNTKAGRSEYAIGPDNLDTFIDSNFLLMVAAGNFFGFTGRVKPYEVSTTQVGSLALRGDFRGAIRALGRSWVQALQDPGWWIQAISATLGPLAAEGKIANVAGESAESGLAGDVGTTLSGGGQSLPPPSPQNVLVVGAETEGEFGYASEVAGRGHNVTVVNPQVTAEAEVYASRGGNFVHGKIEDLPAEPIFNVIREDFPFPMGRAFQPTAEFVNERLARLAPGGRWTVVTESPEFATTLEAAGQVKGITPTVQEFPLYHEGAPQSIYPRETSRFVLIFEKPQ